MMAVQERDNASRQNGKKRSLHKKKSHLGTTRRVVSCTPLQIPSSSSSSSSPSSVSSSRTRFALFIKILFRLLEEYNDGDLKLRIKAKEVVLHCTKRNRMGDPDYASLMDSIVTPLQQLVGPTLWNSSMELTQQYMVLNKKVSLVAAQQVQTTEEQQQMRQR